MYQTRECFAVSQLAVKHTVEYGKTPGDFKVDGQRTFEVGGQDKSFDQIADLPNSFVLADNLEFPIGKNFRYGLLGLSTDVLRAYGLLSGFLCPR